MPRHSGFRFHERADCGFDHFDRLLTGLIQISDPAIRGEVRAALETDGRDLDVADLAAHYALSDEVAETVRQLAAFGDEGELVHGFGAVHIAQINAGSWLGHCDLSTFVLARRHQGQIAVWFQDENGGSGELGIRVEPLTMLDAIVLVDATLIAQAPYAVTGDDWRSAYCSDPTTHLQVHSRHFPQLPAWYRATTAEWAATRSG